ncbi:MAG: hypothetical protein NZM43_03070 [Saprospiraceae bacterium]|nr:hypothetical protein [Saprospiraceae bacterium]MDW8483285.1 hypothetical protein [Saprospiraceae bacterium]
MVKAFSKEQPALSVRLRVLHQYRETSGAKVGAIPQTLLRPYAESNGHWQARWNAAFYESYCLVVASTLSLL